MIKLKVAKHRIIEIEKQHLNHFKNIVIDLIDRQIEQYKTDKNYTPLLKYLKANVETLLIGEIDKLKELITFIEENYYISSTKLKQIKKKRQEYGATVKNKKIFKYLKEKQLTAFLPSGSQVYRTVKDFEKDLDQLIAKNEKYGTALNKIFNYNNFAKKGQKNWSGYRLVESLGVQVCPYCDRQFVNTLNKGEKKARAVLDHYYSKSLYPYLAISLFNLIPCCYTCNSTFKGNKDFYDNEAIYPYSESFGTDAKFTINLDKKDIVNVTKGLSESFDIDITITSKDELVNQKIKNTIDVFGIKEMYQFHKLYIKNLIRLVHINNKTRIQELYQDYPQLFSSEKDIETILFQGMNNELNLGNHVLAKLTHDIINELKNT